MKIGKNLLILFALLFVLGVVVVFGKSKQTTPLASPKRSEGGPTVSSGKVPNIPFVLPTGFTIHVFAENLGTPRDLVFSQNGTLLVSNPISNQVIALPDKNNDGVADDRKPVINSGNHLHGLAFYANKLFVAEVNRVVRYNWDEQKLEATLDKVLFSLPNNNDHNNRTLVFDNKGTMYVSVGSTCDVCYEKSELSATVIVSDSDGTKPKVFAKGLRNAPFLAFNPQKNQLWATEMGRDWLGDNLPPDEINIIKSGTNYGWPICYGNKIHDIDYDRDRYYIMNPCTYTEPPIFEIPAHSAPLGLTFIKSDQFPSDWQNDLLVSYHGSWNRTVPTGYKVVRLKVHENTIVSAEDFLTGFIQGANVLGRPVDLIFDNKGNLYISEDKSGTIFIIQKQQ